MARHCLLRQTANRLCGTCATRFKERVLWIDAICINQESVEEKQLQVPLMGRVYNLAKRVIAWLGVGLPGDEAMLVKVRVGGWAYSLRDPPGRSCFPRITSIGHPKQFVSPNTRLSPKV